MAKLTKNLKTVQHDFNPSMLKTGEMMVVIGTRCAGHILMRFNDIIVSLTNPNLYWLKADTNLNIISLEGRKLREGEFVTLTQE